MRSLFAFAVVAVCLLANGVPSAVAADQPNIIYFLADDLGWADVGWHGSEIKTPNLDKLASGGAKLEQFYVLPVCSPTRAALLPGRYPIRHGLQVSVVRPWAQYGLPLDERTLPQALKEAGYSTHLRGKWHLGHFQPDYLLTRRGFDTQFGHYNGAPDYFTHDRDGGHDWHRNDQESRDEGYTTLLLGNEPLHIVDCFPTLVNLVGGSLQQQHPLDGRDIWPVITAGKTSPHEDILINAMPNSGPVRMGGWKLVLNGHITANDLENATAPKAGAKKDADSVVELFHLTEDPYEQNNRAAQNPERVRQLRARLEAYQAAAVPPKAENQPANHQPPRVWGQ